MEDKNLIKAEALQKLFGESPQDQFKKKNSLEKDSITAWVEILAALLGLCIAFLWLMMPITPVKIRISVLL